MILDKSTKIKTVTVLCPIYNEAENVIDFYREFKKITSAIDGVNFQYLFADNNSSDESVSIVQGLCDAEKDVGLIKYSKNFGYMKSIYTGFINSDTDACVIFDCDLQDPPQLLFDFIQKWREGYKVVYGMRGTRIERRSLGFLRSSFRKFEIFIKGYKVEIESGAWFLDRKVIDELRRLRFDPYLPGLISRLGFKTIGIPYHREARKSGTPKGNTFLYLAYARDGLVSGTITPLRLTSLFGVILSTISFLTMFYFLIAKLLLGAPFASGVAALSIFVLFGFGVNFIFLGILGEYIGRIYLERENSEAAIIEMRYP